MRLTGRRPLTLLVGSVLLLVAAMVLAACGSGGSKAGTTDGGADASSTGQTSAVRTRTIARGLHVPWGIVFLPGGAALVSERTTGRIIRIPRGGGRPRVAMRVPGVDTRSGEGGLLGLALSPHYRRDRLIYAYMTTARDNRVVRFRLRGRLHPVLTGLRHGMIHNGGRIAFGPDGKLYIGVGEAGDEQLAQSLRSRNGKILRINPDGSIPRDNPFRGSPIWSYGNRNVEGFAWDRAGRMWEAELGQDRFDEVNLIRKGRNYGWPVVEGRGSTHGGRYTNPLVTWSPEDASPGGAAILGSTLYVGTLRGESLWRIPLHGRRTGRPVRLLEGRFGRLRTVVRAPSGALWVATSNLDGRGSPRPGDDRIVRVTVR